MGQWSEMLDGRPTRTHAITEQEQAQQRAQWAAIEARRADARKRADQKYEAAQQEKRAAVEQTRRDQAEAEAAKVRATIERELTLSGIPLSGLKKATDAAMEAHFARLAAEVVELGDRQTAELKAYFKRQFLTAYEPKPGPA